MSDVMQHPDAWDGPGEPKSRPEREAPKKPRKSSKKKTAKSAKETKVADETGATT